MKILIDADACPVVNITEKIAKREKLPLVRICDTSHIIHSRYGKVIVVDRGKDSADFKLVCETAKGDIVVTQDYGVAAMILGKGAYAIHQSGMWYTKDNIDQMLFERHLSKKARRGSSHYNGKGLKRRTMEDNERFDVSLQKMIAAAKSST